MAAQGLGNKLFRDSAARVSRTNAMDASDDPSLADNHNLPWGIALGRANLWSMFLEVFGYVYALYFFISWLHTFLVRGRGFSERFRSR